MRPIVAAALFLLVTSGTSAHNGLSFTYQVDGPAPPAQTFSITSADPNQQIPYLFLVVNPTAWLVASLSSSTTPAVLTVSLLQAGINNLLPGTYSGDVEVLSVFSSNVIDVPIQLTVVPAAPRLSLSPTGFTFNAVQGGPVAEVQQLVVGASNPGVGVFSTYSSALPQWLLIYNPTPQNPKAPWSGAATAPVTLGIVVDPSGMFPAERPCWQQQRRRAECHGQSLGSLAVGECTIGDYSLYPDCPARLFRTASRQLHRQDQHHRHFQLRCADRQRRYHRGAADSLRDRGDQRGAAGPGHPGVHRYPGSAQYGNHIRQQPRR